MGRIFLRRNYSNGNSGVKIPQEVLLWAHAQQESDVTAYEVISTTSAIDDNSSTEELVGDLI